MVISLTKKRYVRAYRIRPFFISQKQFFRKKYYAEDVIQKKIYPNSRNSVGDIPKTRCTYRLKYETEEKFIISPVSEKYLSLQKIKTPCGVC